MKKDETFEINGAFIERGVIFEKTAVESESAASLENGADAGSTENAGSADSASDTETVAVTNAVYGVRDLDRRGLVFYGLRVRDGEEYEIGDMVYFFAFGDGTGAIVGKV